MPKRKLHSVPGMHPSNPYYSNPPDFVALAEQYPSFKPYVTAKTTGSKVRGAINFRDPEALRELTYCLLRKDFSIELDIPIGSLCPAVPNRVNYICWIEDLMHNNSKSTINGIDIGTGASCIYPLLARARNKNWKMVATDIDDRSISFANKNVLDNNFHQSISVLKNTSSNIFPSVLFEAKEQKYDFCMCNPPFYEDEQDIQEGFDGKEEEPSAVCHGTSNEMMTAGGEVQFVKQMIDESRHWQTRIRWYTSMLGKKNSLDDIIAYLKDHKILNYTLTTLRQGRTSRWAVAWSFGDEHASWASMQHISNKMTKLTAPATVLSFEVSDTNAEEAVSSAKSLLEQLAIDCQPAEAEFTNEPEGSRALFHGKARTNTWSRAARRAMARGTKHGDGGQSDTVASENMDQSTTLTIMGFDLRIFSSKEQELEESTSSTPLTVELTWTVGQDRDLFESFFLHFRSRLLPAHDRHHH
ncbi:hypothetical protein EDD21DRAFT_384851 [Dissophora ornata]|nr:hypothetical protein EDD21DRAFT_384851 [Dissophora ornata]